MPDITSPGQLSLKDHSIAAIVPAAGRGLRMGKEPKLLLPMGDGRPVIVHAVCGVLRFSPLETVVVVRPDMPNIMEIEQALEGLAVRCVPNPRYMEGMGTSLAAGVAALGQDVQGVLIMLGDEPAVSAHIVVELVGAHLANRKAVTIARYGTQFGPPTLFSAQAFPLLKALEGDTGGKQLAMQHPEITCVVHFDEQDRPQDVDTQEDYRALL